MSKTRSNKSPSQNKTRKTSLTANNNNNEHINDIYDSINFKDVQTNTFYDSNLIKKISEYKNLALTYENHLEINKKLKTLWTNTGKLSTLQKQKLYDICKKIKDNGLKHFLIIYYGQIENDVHADDDKELLKKMILKIDSSDTKLISPKTTIFLIIIFIRDPTIINDMIVQDRWKYESPRSLVCELFLMIYFALKYYNIECLNALKNYDDYIDKLKSFNFTKKLKSTSTIILDNILSFSGKENINEMISDFNDKMDKLNIENYKITFDEFKDGLLYYNNFLSNIKTTSSKEKYDIFDTIEFFTNPANENLIKTIYPMQQLGIHMPIDAVDELQSYL